MGAVVAVNFIIETLLDLPADALPGEDSSEAMRDFLVASTRREVEAVGEDACRAAAALIEAVIARMADDAIATAELAGMAGERLC